jgi:hypothetical protein
MDDIPAIKRFSDSNKLAVQAQQMWLILCGYAMFVKKTITYGDLATLMGYADRRAGHMLSRQLGIVGIYCKRNDLPPLNTIVVNAETKMPGHDVVVRDGRTPQQEIDAVLAEDWFAFRVPTTGTFRQVWESMGN